MFTRAHNAGIAFILVTVLLDVMAFSLIIPVLPALVGEFTGSRDAQSYWYGILAASFGVMQFATAPLLGALSDRFGRRPVLLVSVFGLAGDFLLQALATSMAVLLLARLLGGATAATITVAHAYVADVTNAEDRSRGFGRIGAMFGIGFIIGPALGGLLGDGNIRLPFFVAAALALLNGLYGLLVLPESLPRQLRTRFEWRKANPFSALVGLAGLRGVRGLVAAIVLLNLANFILHSTWVLYTEARYGWGPRDNGIALFLVGVSAATVQGGLLGILLRRWGEEGTALVGLVVSVVAFALYGLATEGWMLYVFIAATFLGGGANPALQGLISKAVDPSRQGITFGAINGASSLMAIIAPLIGTTLLAQFVHLPRDDWRFGTTFYVSAALCALAMTIALRRLVR